MKVVTFATALSGLALCTTSALADSAVLVKNYLPSTIYLTIYQNKTTTGPFPLDSAEAYISDVIGQGDTCTVSRVPDIYSPSTAKMVLGSSTYNGILYWSINNNSGDPFNGTPWNVSSDSTTPDICGNTTHYGNSVYACQDNDVVLTLSLG